MDGHVAAANERVGAGRCGEDHVRDAVRIHLQHHDIPIFTGRDEYRRPIAGIVAVAVQIQSYRRRFITRVGGHLRRRSTERLRQA